MNAETVPGLIDRLREVAKDVGSGDALARASGVPRRTLENYLSGRNEPKLSALIAIAQTGQVTLDWLATGKEPKREQARGAPQAANAADEVLVPRYDIALAAGAGRLLDEANIVRYLPVSRRALEKLGADPKSVIAFEASGKSMEPTIRNHDEVLCDRSKSDLVSDFVYAFRINNELRVKRLSSGFKVDLIIRSDNPEFPDEMLDFSDVDDFEIIGRVMSVYTKSIE